jgi:hypothetical protein
VADRASRRDDRGGFRVAAAFDRLKRSRNHDRCCYANGFAAIGRGAFFSD